MTAALPRIAAAGATTPAAARAAAARPAAAGAPPRSSPPPASSVPTDVRPAAAKGRIRNLWRSYGPGASVRRVTGGGAPWSRGGRSESVGQSVAGVIMGVLFWGWVVLPLVRGGPTEVRNTLRAKFLNKDPQGRWLP